MNNPACIRILKKAHLAAVFLMTTVLAYTQQFLDIHPLYTGAALRRVPDIHDYCFAVYLALTFLGNFAFRRFRRPALSLAIS
jgi:hypothetical protein